MFQLFVVGFIFAFTHIHKLQLDFLTAPCCCNWRSPAHCIHHVNWPNDFSCCCFSSFQLETFTPVSFIISFVACTCYEIISSKNSYYDYYKNEENECFSCRGLPCVSACGVSRGYLGRKLKSVDFGAHACGLYIYDAVGFRTPSSLQRDFFLLFSIRT